MPTPIPSSSKSPPVNAVAGELRAATRSQHRALQAAFETLRPHAGEALYTNCLCKLFGYYRPAERTLGRHFRATALSSRLGKSELLWGDLRALGLDDDAIEALPDCGDIPRTHLSASAFGVLYVLEGATLGMQRQLPRLRQALPETMERASRFVVGYGERTRAMWSDFVTTLASALTDPPSVELAVRAAQDAFNGFRLWLRGPVSAPRIRLR